MKKQITQAQLYRYFRGESTSSERQAISEWLSLSEENKATYRKASALYETYLMEAPLELLEHGDCRSRFQIRRHDIFRKVMIALANVAAIAAIAFVAWDIVPEKISDNLAEGRTTIEASPGQILDLTLSDGSIVKLNSGARLTYPNRFDRKVRKVELEGEAYFEVAHNAEQPFVVNTYASDIEVLGTKFNVNADEENHIFTAVLVEGSVRVTAGKNQKLIMKPGEKVIMNHGRLEKMSSFEESDIYWTDGLIDISGIAFADLMRKFEKAFGIEIVIDSPEVPKLDIAAGEVRISDGVSYSLDLLKNFADFTYKRDYKTGTIHIR